MSLSLEDHQLNAIPELEPILNVAKALMEDVPSWHRGKVYHGVKTSKKTAGSGPSWYSRTSIHPATEGTFDEFWSCLGINHSSNEKEYIPEIQSANLLGAFGEFQAWSLGYRFTPPISNRTFTFLIASVLEESPVRQGYVISLPLDVSSDESLKNKEPSGVRGHYVSIERVRELDGQVEWTMATMSAPGGMIPSFLSEGAMPSKISEVGFGPGVAFDVPHVLDWIKNKRQT